MARDDSTLASKLLNRISDMIDSFKVTNADKATLRSHRKAESFFAETLETMADDRAEAEKNKMILSKNTKRQIAEYGEEKYTPYSVTINVKEKDDGEHVYSFNAEKESSTQRTLHAAVNTRKGANGELFIDSIHDNEQKTTPLKKHLKKLILTSLLPKGKSIGELPSGRR